MPLPAAVPPTKGLPIPTVLQTFEVQAYLLPAALPGGNLHPADSEFCNALPPPPSPAPTTQLHFCQRQWAIINASVLHSH